MKRAAPSKSTNKKYVCMRQRNKEPMKHLQIVLCTSNRLSESQLSDGRDSDSEAGKCGVSCGEKRRGDEMQRRETGDAAGAVELVHMGGASSCGSALGAASRSVRDVRLDAHVLRVCVLQLCSYDFVYVSFMSNSSLPAPLCFI
ncbi:hypothetical protein KSP40_PGU015431 [Platanthera guangdongensis]|uniref:Uncharacterized protein n=1 Tax=Platanthera guangdongensis TaxID=2320717 RepID=A0ABR2LGZ5_9ASPA